MLQYGVENWTSLIEKVVMASQRLYARGKHEIDIRHRGRKH